MANKAPGFARKPEHKVELSRDGKRVRVRFNGAVVADSTDAVTLNETGYKPVYYLPRKDVRMEMLTRTEHHSTCPFKGEASYWTVQSGDRVAENAVWSYETPYDEVLGIKELVAFWDGRIDAIEVG